jgi:hypothetical protein
MDPGQCHQRADGVWVCGDCGFAYELSAPEVGARLADGKDRMGQVVAALGPGRLDRSSGAGVWTAREYIAHVVDWAEITDQRIRRVLSEDRPTLESYDQDLLATERAYASWDITATLERYGRAVGSVRRALDEAGAEGWRRVGFRDEAGEMPLSLFANDLVHELEHHLDDVERVSRGQDER